MTDDGDGEIYLPTIFLPAGTDWECSRCDATGDSHEETLIEHYRAEHPDAFGGKE